MIGSLGQEIQESILQSTQSLQVVQARLRTELISLNSFRIPALQSNKTPTIEEAVRVGLENRLDLMNAKAEVMDARRQVEIAANALEASLNLVVDGSADTLPGASRPFQFRRQLTQLDVGVQFTTPLDQIDERNNYATALVTYQRVRRAYMAFEDQVKQQIRAEYRSLRVAEQQLEIRRRQLRQAGQQYEATALQVTAPPGAGRQTTSFDLLNSLSSLLTAQNGLIDEWVDYEISRLNIFRDMGIMDVDAAGVWVDDFYQDGQNSPSSSGFIVDDLDDPAYDPRSPDPVINFDESPTDEGTFPLDDAVSEPFLPEQAPLPPAASRRVRDVDDPRVADRRRDRGAGSTRSSRFRIGDVLRAGFRRLR